MSDILNRFIANATGTIPKHWDVVALVGTGKGFDLTLPLIENEDIKNGKRIIFIDLGAGGISSGTPIRIKPNAGDGSTIGEYGLSEIIITDPFTHFIMYPMIEPGRGALRWMVVADSRLMKHLMNCQPVDLGTNLAVATNFRKRIIIPHEYDRWYIQTWSVSALYQVAGVGNLTVDLTDTGVNIPGSTVILASGGPLFGNAVNLHHQVFEGTQIDINISTIPTPAAVFTGIEYSICLIPY